MKCPLCGNELRPSKKDPSYGLCDNCRKKFKINKVRTSTKMSGKKEKPITPVETNKNEAQKNKKKTGNLFKFFLVFFLIVVLAGLAYFFLGKEDPSTDDSDPSAQTTNTENNSEKTVTYAETYNDITISLKKTSESAGSDLASPSDGNIFYICEFEVTNNSSEDITIYSLSCIEAFCGDYSVSEDISGLLLPELEGKNSLDGTVAAGQTFTGVVTYQIPEDYTQMQLRITPDFWGGESATFTIPKE